LTTANVTLVLVGLATGALILGYDCLEKRRFGTPEQLGDRAKRLKLAIVSHPAQLIRKSRAAISSAMGWAK